MQIHLPDLPIVEIIAHVKQTLVSRHAVVCAPPGSGKTTLLPLALLDEHWLAGAKILLLEPRRIAARSAAVRMSALLGSVCGETVGYQTRYESCISPATRIEVITEGILIRRLQSDPELKGISLIIFDEFHERSLHADLGLALALDLCQLRTDLRLLVMSATIDTEAICCLLGNANIHTAGGRLYPVEIRSLPPIDPNSPIAAQAARAVQHVWKSHHGNILVFLPGAGEIHQCRDILPDSIPAESVLPLYGSLSLQEQDKIFHLLPDRRYVILATPIAETSITIEGITTVIDSGFCRRPIYSPSNGLSSLRLLRIARDSAEQRAGRAGRLGPGLCYQLWDKKTDYGLLSRTPPEIHQGDLAALVLELALYGVHEPNQLAWLDPPRPSSWQTAVNLLKLLGFLSQQGRITEEGRNAAALPLHPRLAAMLLAADKQNLLYTAALTALCLEERENRRSDSADISEQVQILDRQYKRVAPDTGSDNRSQHRRLIQQIDQLMKRADAKNRHTLDCASIGCLLPYAYPDRIALKRMGTRCSYRLAGGASLELQPDDHLQTSRLLVVAHLDHRQKSGRIFLAAPVSQEDLLAHHPHLFRTENSIFWDKEEERIRSERQQYVQDLLLSAQPVVATNNDETLKVMLQGIRDNFSALAWTKEVRNLQARVACLGDWQKGMWPDWTDTALAADLSWLAPYCAGFTSLNQAKTLDLKKILLATLDWSRQQQLDQLAPIKINAPSGSAIPIIYTPGEPPVLAVRLQEVFGLTESPTICDGKISLLMHLLSPAGRPMQITADLRSFWQNTYPEVRKELAGRYPKHSWPEDPFTAQPLRGAKRSLKKG